MPVGTRRTWPTARTILAARRPTPRDPRRDPRVLRPATARPPKRGKSFAQLYIPRNLRSFPGRMAASHTDQMEPEPAPGHNCSC